jgi:phosphoribosylamine--glycine ligase
MNVLLLGSGGREHALAWKISRSPLVSRLYVLPGSDGIAALPKTECLPGNAIAMADVLIAAQRIKPDLIVVGPESVLEAGVSDALVKSGFLVSAPSRAAAQLETSKIFSKQFMTSVGIPTAPFTVCHSHDEAAAALRSWPVEKEGVVIKADGLATGKGVVVTHDRAEAETTLYDFMKNPACTVKTDKVLLEKKVTGKEVSAFALCDGETFIPLGYACDYKRVNDGNQGHNTGGMGGYTPEGWPSAQVRQFVNEQIFKKTVDGMKKNGVPYTGFLYAGLMIEGDAVNVIEFNARFGDPEAQILLPLIEDDLVPLLQAAAKQELAKAGPVSLGKSSAVHVVMVSEGYPDVMGAGMRLGEKISLPASLNDNALLFIAGAKKKDGDWINSGGRVLGVTAIGATIEEARKNAYKAIENIHFNGAHWRKDIGR